MDASLSKNANHNERTIDARRQVVVLSLITALCLTGDSMLYIVLPIYWKEAGLNSLWEVGVLLSVNRFVRIPLNPLVSRLYRVIPLRTGLIIAVILGIAVNFSYGWVQSFGVWIVFRCLWGTAWTLLRLGAYFRIMELGEEKQRGYLLGTYNGWFRLGSLAGMLLGGFICDVWGLLPASLLFGGCALLALPLSWGVKENDAGKSEERKLPLASVRPRNVPTAFRSFGLHWVLLISITVAIVYEGMLNSTLSHCLSTKSVSFVVGGTVIGSSSLAGALQALRWGWGPFLSPWIGKVTDGSIAKLPVLYGAMLLGGGLFFVLPFPLPTAVLFAVLIGILLTSTTLTTVADSIASDAAAAGGRKEMMMLHSTALDIGTALGPLASYFLLNRFGDTALYWSASALLVLAALLAGSRLRLPVGR